MTFAIVSMARTGSTSVYRVLSSAPGIRIAYEPDFSAPSVNVDSVQRRCVELFAEYTGIKHVWDPNGWPFRNREYISSVDVLQESGELIELNAIIANFPDKVVFLRRRDQFARVVSDHLGQQSGLWGHDPGEPYSPAEQYEYREAMANHEFKKLDPTVLAWYIANTQKQEDDLITRVPLDRRRVIYYEQLFDAASWNNGDFSTWQDLSSWIGVEPRFFDEEVRNVMRPQNKYNSDEMYERIPNYRELAKQFRDHN